MKYDFDKMTNRRKTGSLKWDISEGELPMWVADMDFETAPEIVEALQRKVSEKIFGYNIIPDEWYQAYIGWWSRRHGISFEKDSLIFCTGVVPAISSIVRKLTTVGEKVLIQTPVYNIFFNSILNNGRNVLECPLEYDGVKYGIDFDELEMKLSDPQTTMMILCNPHNPVGKIWSREELDRIGALCEKHHVIVVSDEIHCDLTDPGCEYVPFAAASECCRRNSITCIAPTKSFGIPGIQTAAVMIPNPVLRHKVWRGLNTDEVAEPNSFAVDAAVAAFEQGESWLDEVRTYLYENKSLAREYISERIPSIRVVASQATYLLWLDCSAVTTDGTALTEFIRAYSGLFLCEGEEYGSCGKSFLRMNVACPRERLMDGLNRLEKSIKAFRE